ncbi:MAG: SCP2 sterol-binding domain-containing protein, partial [Ilumatobacteraceae bacterium]
LLRTIPIVVGKRARTPEGRGVVLEITGPVRRHVPVLVTNGRAAIVDAVADPIATLKMDSNTFCELALGRVDPLSKKVDVVGDHELGMAITANLNMMI